MTEALSMRSLLSLSVILIGASGARPAEAKSARTRLRPIPTELLFGNSMRASPRLSPDGKRIVYLAVHEGAMNLWLRDLTSGSETVLTRESGSGVSAPVWAGNERVLFLKSAAKGQVLAAIDLATKAVREIISEPSSAITVLGVDPKSPKQALVVLNKDDPNVPDVYALDLAGGTLNRVAKNPGNLTGFALDSSFQLRGAIARLPEGGAQVMVRGKDGEWKAIASWTSKEAAGSRLVGFSKNADEAYLIDARGSDTARLVRVTIGSGAMSVLASDPTYDVMGMLINPITFEPEVISYFKDRHDVVSLDRKLRPHLEALRRANDGDFFFAGRDVANKKWLIQFTSDQHGLSFSVYDRETKRAQFLFDAISELREYQLSPMEAISLRTGDGLTLHGYAVFPSGMPRNRLPTVVSVHSGPGQRDSWGFDPTCQWFASRGALCLRINYRGSTGYGQRFLNAGNKEWGAKIQDDIVDTVKWAVGKGFADANRVAIYGVGMGGTEALFGATAHPEVFRCAAAIRPVTDLLAYAQSSPPGGIAFRSVVRQVIGEPGREDDSLRARCRFHTWGLAPLLC